MSWRGKVRREKGRDVGGDSSMEIKWRVGGGCIRVTKNDSSVYMQMMSHSNDVIITVANDISLL